MKPDTKNFLFFQNNTVLFYIFIKKNYTLIKVKKNII